MTDTIRYVATGAAGSEVKQWCHADGAFMMFSVAILSVHASILGVLMAIKNRRRKP